MARAALERLRAWWKASGGPFVVGWWQDLEEHPGFHFASMMVGLVLLYLVKFMAWVIA